MSKIKEQIQNLNIINTDEIGNVEKICEGSIGIIYKLINESEPLAIKCVKNVKILNELIAKE